jgi:hypothetical protein
VVQRCHVTDVSRLQLCQLCDRLEWGTRWKLWRVTGLFPFPLLRATSTHKPQTTNHSDMIGTRMEARHAARARPAVPSHGQSKRMLLVLPWRQLWFASWCTGEESSGLF